MIQLSKDEQEDKDTNNIEGKVKDRGIITEKDFINDLYEHGIQTVIYLTGAFFYELIQIEARLRELTMQSRAITKRIEERHEDEREDIIPFPPTLAKTYPEIKPKLQELENQIENGMNGGIHDSKNKNDIGGDIGEYIGQTITNALSESIEILTDILEGSGIQIFNQKQNKDDVNKIKYGTINKGICLQCCIQVIL
ncbi:MAG: hypothetical protein EZS28_001739 [Streblomastix strix]|uniref:Uncharacterized protein n=1 Tax=Streblomastix strix TaxID=222440 RepID=A0A5J4X6A3_9EUKA|nr:MAG: hypothetical protein EZS28_001739 [Streblomastix strix]